MRKSISTRRFMKNRAVYLLILVFVLTMLFGCSAEKKKESPENSETVTTTITSEPTPTPTPSPSPSPTPTPTPRLVKVIKYEAVAGDWVPYQKDEYDDNENKIRTQYSDGEKIYEYNENDQCIKESYSSSISTSVKEYVYDGDLLIKTTEDFKMENYNMETIYTNVYEYDDRGKTIVAYYTCEHIDDGTKSESKGEYEYDSDDRLVKKTFYDTDSGELEYDSVTKYEYGRSGNLVRETFDSEGIGLTTTVYEYDDMGRIIKETIDFSSYSIYLSSYSTSYEYEYFYE